MENFIKLITGVCGAALVAGFTGCSNVMPSLPMPGNSKDDTLKLQIFLDSENFGPGVIDGKKGEFTTKALVLYRQANGLPEGQMPDLSGIQSYTSYSISSSDLEVIGEMASGAEAQSQLSKMPYTSLIELLSERFHTTQTFLRSLNPGMNLNSLPAGTTVKVPNTARPFLYHSYPSGYPAPSSATAQSRTVIVNLQQKMLQVTEGGRTLAAFPITPGSSAHPAPVGEWRITGSVPWPWYRHDEGVLSRGERTDDFYNLPPGPNNPVGILWAGLNRSGVGIHGSPVPDTIGRAGSHGCIRLSNWDAATFHTLIGKGTKVSIQ
ncbi:L,D-transpeptidase family protein [Luteolibacter sp. AS25]|uniref:L,D-transpeptidase family protein n=1 Tax=Luteolibacter sp. AS25 TaxID=3135776 RepID=UPI00398B0ED0